MERTDLLANTTELIAKCFKTLEKAQEEYSAESDALSNFKEVGALLDISPEKVAFIYFYKHVVGISKYVKSNKPQRDSFRGRIEDAINYLFLLDALFHERISSEAGRDPTSDAHDTLSETQSNPNSNQTRLREGFNSVLRDTKERDAATSFKRI